MKTIFYSLFRLFRLAVAKPKTILFCALAIYIGSICALPQLKILSNIDDLIDKDFKTYKSLQDLNTEFTNKNNSLLFVKPRNRSFLKKDFCKITNWVNDEIKNNNNLDVVITSADIKKLELNNNKFKYKPFLDINCHITADYNSNISKLFKEIYNESPWKNIFISSSEDDFIVDFYFSETNSNKQFGSFNTDVVKELMNSFDNFIINNNDYEHYWSGLATFQYHLRVAYEQTAALNLIIVILVLLSFYFIWGTFKSGFLYIITVSLSSTIIYGCLALSGSPIDVLSNSISLLIFVSSIEDFIFLSFLLQKTGNWKLSFKKLLIPSFLTSLTTFIGFGSLYFTDLDIIRRFGLWAAVGALVEWFAVFIFLPAFISKFPYWQNWVKKENKKIINFCEKINHINIPKPISLLFLLVIPLSFFSFSKLNVSDSPQKIFPKSHISWDTINYIDTTRNWQSYISLVFDDKSNSDFNRNVIKSIKSHKNITAIENPYEIDKFISSKFDSQNLKDVFINHWEESLLGQKYNTPEGKTRALLYLNDLDINTINDITSQSHRLCPNDECHFAGSLVSYAEFGNKVLGSLFKSFGVSLLLVLIVLLFLMFKLKTKHKLAVILSSFWGPLALICIFYLFDIPATYVTSLMASILVGLAGDNAIQFIFKKKSIHADIKYFQTASIIVTFSMILLASSFFFSFFESLRDLGGLMIIGFILNYVGDVFILKSLTKK